MSAFTSSFINFSILNFRWCDTNLMLFLPCKQIHLYIYSIYWACIWSSWLSAYLYTQREMTEYTVMIMINRGMCVRFCIFINKIRNVCFSIISLAYTQSHAHKHESSSKIKQSISSENVLKCCEIISSELIVQLQSPNH